MDKEDVVHMCNVILLRVRSGGLDDEESACSAGDPGLIRGLGRFPGKEMATPSSILAWKIPWTEEPGRLQSVYGVAESWTRLSDVTFFFASEVDEPRACYVE